jgi:hypothetical protein
MSRRSSIVFAFLYSILLLQSGTLAQGTGVSIDRIEHTVLDTVEAGNVATFHIRLTNDTEWHYNFNNGFRIWSPDGAEWSYPGRDTTYCWEAPGVDACGWGNDTWVDSILADRSFFWFDRFSSTLQRVYFSCDGAGADTVGYAGASNSDTLGLPAYWTGVPLHIPIQTRLQDTGKTICIDSSWFPPGGTWKWAGISPGGAGQVSPEWSGPHCFTLKAGCCVGMTGNADGDPLDVVDVGDLTAWIQWLYVYPNPPPPCFEELNVDGDASGIVDIGDLTALIAYLYIPPNPLPAPCQ